MVLILFVTYRLSYEIYALPDLIRTTEGDSYS